MNVERAPKSSSRPKKSKRRRNAASTSGLESALLQLAERRKHLTATAPDVCVKEPAIIALKSTVDANTAEKIKMAEQLVSLSHPSVMLVPAANQESKAAFPLKKGEYKDKKSVNSRETQLDRTSDALLQFRRAAAKLRESPEVAVPDVRLYSTGGCFEKVSCAALSRERGGLLAVGAENSIVEVWNLSGSNELDHPPEGQLATMDVSAFYGSGCRRLLGHTGSVYGLAFCPTLTKGMDWKSISGYLLSCSQDSTIKLWNLDTLKDAVTYRGHSGPVLCVEQFTTKSFFVSGSMDQTCLLWEHRSSGPRRAFVSHKSPVTAVAVHPNEQYVFSGSSDGQIRMWTIETGHPVRMLVGHRASVLTLDCSSDGRLLASGADDRIVRLWDLRTGAEALSFASHTASVYAVEASPSNTQVVSGDGEGTVALWDVRWGCGERIRENVTSALQTWETDCSCILDVRWADSGLVNVAGKCQFD